MTPDDIRSQRFSTRLLQGLSPEEVSAFLEDVAEAFATVQDTNTSLTTRVKTLEDEIQALATRPVAPLPSPDILRDAEAQAESMIRLVQEKEASASTHIEVLRATVLREVEALLHDAHVQVQTLVEGAKVREAEILLDAETLRARMQVEADEVVAAATRRAESLLMAAREQEAEIRNEIDRLIQSRLQLVDEVRATLDTYHQWLANVDPGGRARGRREALDLADDHGDGAGAVEESRAG
jgi:DivIVA domain-containing protein